MKKTGFFVLLFLISSFVYSLEYLGSDTPGSNSPQFMLFKSNSKMDAYRLFTDEIRTAISMALYILEATPHVELPDLSDNMKNFMRRYGADLMVTVVPDSDGVALYMYRYLDGKYYIYTAKFYAYE
jgi:hypothetical protein